MIYLAHTRPEENREQTVSAHLTGTAELAARFAKAFSAEETGYLCGMLHDIGKYSQKFQRRIRGAKERVDHSTAGAQTALLQMRNAPAALCIAGHHGGLPDCGSKKFAAPEDGSFFGKMRRQVGKEIEDYSAWQSEIQITPVGNPKNLPTDPCSQFFFTRMLFSCLVDADYLDTEAFMENGSISRGGRESLAELEKKLEAHIAPWWDSEIEINQKRCGILKALIEGGSQPKGLFRLTVPTGGGKTVSSMAFALRHAQKHSMPRIIYVIPYTSIIEQTQAVFEKIFGADNVVAHYATMDYETNEEGKITDRRYLAAENWDAPIILTTSVQFFESLYANKPGRCRKLHNIANSVILFDEAQMLPVPYLSPCIAAITLLLQQYGCSAVLCSATQPALDRLIEKAAPGLKATELCPEVPEMYSFFQRVQYEKLGLLSDEALAERLNKEEQVLCIVNSRKQAQRVYDLLDGDGRYHLSTMMCPAHRRKVLEEIRTRLEQGNSCKVVSTSLVEAGVDVDFPAVYRALAGLDSMIQAGGRCNREGKRNAWESKVYLFDTEQKPPQVLLQNVAAAKRIFENFEDISSPEAIQAYFEFLYYRLKDENELDKQGILQEIQSGSMAFATVAERFHLIEDSGYVCYVPWDEAGEKYIRSLEVGYHSRGLMRKLGQYSVGVYQPHFNDLVKSGAAAVVGENAAILTNMNLYSGEKGLSFDVEFGIGTFI